MILGIIGNGFVGQATKILKTDDDEMLVYDIDPEKCEPRGITLESLNICDLIFVSVPTPMTSDGQIYLDIVKNVVSELQNYIDSDRTHIIIRSTVLPGTSDELDCFFMPEFLTEKNWDSDFRNCNNWIFGLKKTNNEDFKNKITTLIQSNKKNGNIHYDNVHFVDNAEAEMIKYFRNTFLALKVSFCNEIYDYCVAKNIDYENVRKFATLDNRISASHTKVPGLDGKRGYGGTCFPKDISALIEDFKDNNIDSYILNASRERNNNIDRVEKDWNENIGRSII